MHTQALLLNLAFTSLTVIFACQDDVPKEPTTISGNKVSPIDASALGLRSVGYFANWAIYDRNFSVLDIEPEYFTHILYAFANVSSDTGEVLLADLWADVEKRYDGESWNDLGKNLHGCLNQLWKPKQKQRKLKVFLSIGGWNFKKKIRNGCGSPEKREAFAVSAIALVKNLGLDGLDLDWEYPQSPEEAANFVDVISRCRKHLDALGGDYELSAAGPCGPDNISKLDLKGMDQYLDFWNLMAYDFAGSWSAAAGHRQMAASIASHKLVIGMPLYGRSFLTDGPGQPFQIEAAGTFNEAGVWDLKILPLPKAIEHYSDEIIASWSYNPVSRQMVSYDNLRVSKNKAGFILSRKLGGAMWWETSGDKKGDGSLVKAVVETLGLESLDQRDNQLEYPESEWENVRRRES
ncbi:Chitotriosidase-1 [Dactylellina cionopaga]|nr:Chitotriosidase-1 [Dactylellina cionopaga]